MFIRFIRTQQVKAIIKVIIISIFSLLSASQSLSSEVESPNINREYETDFFIFVPLGAEHTDLDYKAVMDNKEFLRIVLGWGGWPFDSMTIEEDRKALENHFKEFKEKEAYAVFLPNRKKLLGASPIIRPNWR